MAILPIITAPDRRLKVKSETVDAVDEGVRRLLDDMLETMYAAPGIGLAAVQVGVPRRIIVVDISRAEEERTPVCLINPEIVAASDELWTYEEGCLSLPEQYAEVRRPAQVTVKFLDREGDPQELTVHEVLATCIQHEMDHLEGILFVDHLSALKRSIILRRLTKMRKQAAE